MPDVRINVQVNVPYIPGKELAVRGVELVGRHPCLAATGAAGLVSSVTLAALFIPGLRIEPPVSSPLSSSFFGPQLTS